MKRRAFLGGLVSLPVLCAPRESSAQLAPACLALGIGIMGCLIIIYLFKTKPEQPRVHRIALEKSTNGGPWVMVMIAEVVFDDEHPKVAFAEEIIYTNGPTVYRAVEVPHAPDSAVSKVEPVFTIVPGVPVYRIPK